MNIELQKILADARHVIVARQEKMLAMYYSLHEKKARDQVYGSKEVKR